MKNINIALHDNNNCEQHISLLNMLVGHYKVIINGCDRWK